MGRRFHPETLQKQLFEIYYSMGPSRSLSKLRAKLLEDPKLAEITPSLKTLKKWSKIYGWQKQIAQRDAEIAEELAKRSAEDILEIKRRYRNYIKLFLNEVAKALSDRKKEDKLQVERIRDLQSLANITEVMIKLDLLLLGEKEADFTLELSHEERALLKVLGEELANRLSGS